MEADLENLNLEDEEEEAILCEKNLIEDENEHQLCLVGKASTDCIRKTIEIKEVSFGWNSSFRAPSRTELSSRSKWLWEGVLNGPQRGSNPIRMELELRFKGGTNNKKVAQGD
ncbi:hypothetical protein GOBAR_DD04573 [Gossypium barbadense]|nr:hypothetical protein GOBAR_DD04573 [Gossypium barbadense]